MFNMIRLIQNENMKIYRRISTWIMIGLLLLSVLGVGLIVNNLSDDINNENWKENLILTNEEFNEYLADENILDSVKQEFEKEIQLNNYRIENNIQPVENKSLWGFMEGSDSLISLITLFAVIIGAGIVANEFSWGSIKLLLIRPVNRSKILLSKYLATLIFVLLLLVLLFVSSFLTGGILFGFDGTTQPHLSYQDGNVVESSMVLNILSIYSYGIIDLLLIVSFAFMISTVFRNSSLSIGIAIFLMFTGSNIVLLLSGYDWVKYILFANMNLRQYVDGIPVVEGMTMSFSILMLVIYFVVFNLISWIVFNKRDVSA